jgi:hypothetical protein
MLISFNRCFKYTDSAGLIQAATHIDYLGTVLGQSDANFLVRENLELAFAFHGKGAGSGLKPCLISPKSVSRHNIVPALIVTWHTCFLNVSFPG